MPRIPLQALFLEHLRLGNIPFPLRLKTASHSRSRARGSKLDTLRRSVRIENHDNSIVGVMFALETDLFAGANRRQILRLRIDDYACPSLVTELLR